jgi:ATP-dependent Clp protease ATP-binding subunit ClpC
VEAAGREVDRLGHEHVGTEHLLLALIRVGKGSGARVLHELHIDRDRVRTAVAEISAGRNDPPCDR